MLSIKSFLVALSASPLFFIPFQLPSQSQSQPPISNTFNSKNNPGTASGAGSNGSGGTTISNPPAPTIVTIPAPGAANVVVGSNGQVGATPTAQLSVNTEAGQITTGLTSGDAAQQAVAAALVSTGLSPTAIAQVLRSLTTLAPAISNLPASGGTIPFNGGTIVISTSNLITTPTGTTTTSPESKTTITVTTATGKTTEVTLPAGTLNIPAATAAVSAILANGGTPAQALTAGLLASVSQNTTAAVNLVIALSGLFSGLTANLPGTVPTASLANSSTLVATLNLNSVFAKPLDLEKQILVAQASGTKVDVNKLNQAILAYNKLIDTTTPQGVLALSKNPEFIAIGQTLRKLRAALVR